MKKLITLLLLIIIVSLFTVPAEYLKPFEYSPLKMIDGESVVYKSDKIVYGMDGSCNYTPYIISGAYLKQVGDGHYTLTATSGNFSGVTFTPQLTTIGFEENQVGIRYFRGLVINKSDIMIEFYSGFNIGNKSITEFYIQISTGHAVSTRNKYLATTEGYVDPQYVYAGTIGYSFGLLGLIESFGIDVTYNSNSGFRDSYNTEFSPRLRAVDCRPVNAHGSNSHIYRPDPSYIDWIATSSYSRDDGINHGSYGPGLENMCSEFAQSYSTPVTAGIYTKLWIDYPDKTYEEIRYAVNITASFDEWKENGGYGDIDYQKAFDYLGEITIKPRPPKSLPNNFNPLKMPK